jgi:predicted GNAT superfamily acetyltransferase
MYIISNYNLSKIKAFLFLYRFYIQKYYVENKEEIIAGYKVIMEELLDTTELKKKTANIQNEMKFVEELFKKMVDENSRKVMCYVSQ